MQQSSLLGARVTTARSRKSPAKQHFALLAQLVEHFHGKEGVVGSSPTEGSGESPWWAGVLGFGLVHRAPARAGMETIWKPAAWCCSLTGASRIPGLPFSGMFLVVRAIGPEPRIIHSPAGDRPGWAVFRRGVPCRRRPLKLGHVLRAAAAVVLVDRQDEGLTQLLGEVEHSLLWVRSGAMSAGVDATIVFSRKRSPAARCASESLVPFRSSAPGPPDR